MIKTRLSVKFTRHWMVNEREQWIGEVADRNERDAVCRAETTQHRRTRWAEFLCRRHADGLWTVRHDLSDCQRLAPNRYRFRTECWYDGVGRRPGASRYVGRRRTTQAIDNGGWHRSHRHRRTVAGH